MNTIINSDQSLLIAQGELKREFDKYKFVSIKTDHQKRSIISNSLQFHWYRELEQQGDQTSTEYRCECKYYVGCAIRAEQDEYFAKTLKDIMRKYDLEDRLKIMQFIDVTSTFNREQMTRYLTGIKNRYEPQGYYLTSSGDL